MATKTQIQFVRSLQSRKLRDERGLFVAEGPKVVDELLEAPGVQVQDVFATPRWAETSGERVRRTGGTLVEVDDQTLHRMSSLTTAHGVIAVFSRPRFEPWDESRWSRAFTLVLDGIQDPGNLGTIIRCADWFAVENVVCSSACADAYNAKVVQATMGSITRVRVSYESDLPGFLQNVRGEAAVFAAALGGDNLYEIAPPEAGFVIIGNESRGISDDLLAMTDRLITIPRLGKAESLNAGVATGIVLSHLRR